MTMRLRARKGLNTVPYFRGINGVSAERTNDTVTYFMKRIFLPEGEFVALCYVLKIMLALLNTFSSFETRQGRLGLS